MLSMRKEKIAIALFLLSKEDYPFFQRCSSFRCDTSYSLLYFDLRYDTFRYFLKGSLAFYDLDRKSLPRRPLWILRSRD